MGCGLLVARPIAQWQPVRKAIVSRAPATWVSHASLMGTCSMDFHICMVLVDGCMSRTHMSFDKVAINGWQTTWRQVVVHTDVDAV
jgi:hypothetical protein